MSEREDLDQYAEAYEDSFPYARDNHGVLSAYARALIDSCLTRKGKIRVLSLGIGYELVSRQIGQELSDKIASYTAIEGSGLLIERYRQQAAPTAYPFNLVHDYFETFETDQKYDVIEMGFVLEHVDNPQLIVERYARLLGPNGVICAAVPNALSMHRTLGHRAGLLADPYELNEWDQKLGHKRYYDWQSFNALFRECGLSIRLQAGLMLKPFSTAQMDALGLSDKIWDVLFQSGDLAPDYAYGLYVEVQNPAQ